MMEADRIPIQLICCMHTATEYTGLQDLIPEEPSYSTVKYNGSRDPALDVATAADESPNPHRFISLGRILSLGL
jgi:hypothetical protein